MAVRTSSESSHGRILVVDDDRRMASGLAQWLCGQGWHASAAGSPAEALQAVGRTAWTACILDGDLPGDGGRRIAAAVRSVAPAAGIVAVAAGRGAACDWADASLPRPANDQALLEALQAARAAGRTRAAARPDIPAATVLGSHPALRHVLDVVDRIARTPATVLVTGESGTGKSLLARAIHAASGRAGRFVEVACGSLSESLLESELFGHVAGAYTGATADRDGMFLRADAGTIFLDEIATASPAMQVKLLRVLQDMTFEPVGGSRTLAVDARVILATHEDLSALVTAGRFRADLFWRINVVTIEMPALRQRSQDIPLLAEHFLRAAAARAGRAVDGIAPEAMTALVRHDWPGNVRELQHAVERGVFLGRGPLIVPADLPAAVLAGAARRPVADGAGQAALKESLAAPERQLIVSALEQAGWRRDVAARALGINRTTLYKKLRRLGLDLATLEPAR
jgi:two-component system response regulator AtoC